MSSDVVVLPLAAKFNTLVDDFIVELAAASAVSGAASFANVVDIIVGVVVVGDVVAWARVHLHKGATSSWRQRLSGELPVEYSNGE